MKKQIEYIGLKSFYLSELDILIKNAILTDFYIFTSTNFDLFLLEYSSGLNQYKIIIYFYQVLMIMLLFYDK